MKHICFYICRKLSFKQAKSWSTK